LQASKVMSTQKRAIDYAKQLVVSGEAISIVIHGKNGTFRTAR